MQLRQQARSFAEIEMELDLSAGQGKAFYIHLIRRNANKARRSQQ